MRLLALLLRRAWRRFLWYLDWQVLEGEERQAVLRLLYRLGSRP